MSSSPASSRLPWMLNGALLVLLSGLTLACWPHLRRAAPAGCGKDTDCKGARICIRGSCVEPAVPAAHPAPAGPAPGETAAVPVIGSVGAAAMFQGDWRHQGRSRYLLPQAAPREVARLETQGAIISSPAIADDGTAFFGAHDRIIRAVSRTGELRWQRMTGDLVWSSPALGPGGVVYVGSDDDRLYALDTVDGNVRFTFTAGPCRRAVGVGPEAAHCDVDGVTVGPDGNIYFVADGIYGVRPDGTLLFRFGLPIHCSGAPALAPDRTIYAGCQDGALYALSPEGSKRWEFRAGDDIDSTPTVGDDGRVYFGSDDHKLYALDPAGTLLWALKTEGPIRGSAALGQDGTVYIGSYDNRLYAVRPDGSVAWIFRAADRIHASPLVDAQGAIAIGAQDDRLYAIEPDGRLRWSVLLGGDVDSTAALGPDGTIYVGADDRILHLLRYTGTD